VVLGRGDCLYFCGVGWGYRILGGIGEIGGIGGIGEIGEIGEIGLIGWNNKYKGYEYNKR